MQTIFESDCNMTRCRDWLRHAGGYPLRRIAEFYGVPYDVILCYSDWRKKTKNGEETSHWERNAMLRIDALHEVQRREIAELLDEQEANFRQPGWTS